MNKIAYISNTAFENRLIVGLV